MSAAGHYQLGVDLGTTWTAAAVAREGQVRMVGLGNRTAAIPSVVHQSHDGTVLTGDAADRRGPSEPLRVAREFKRRLGDPTPVLLGGTPYSAEALLGTLLDAVVTRVIEREAGPPGHLAVTHPANWGPYKVELLEQSVGMAGIPAVTTLTEPEAAAMAYAANERVEPGALVAVYDLGGGTFDTAILRKTTDGFAILGQPTGIERLGGIDFDEAVVGHVRATLGWALDRIDPTDPAVLKALTRLRRECVDAKEALSSDTEVTIPVLVPGVQSEVRLTRGEFEAMIRPTLHATVNALRRTLAAAAVEADEISTVLLVGGSSRIPLVAELVSEAFGRPVSVDAHPKHAVALGAARAAALVDDVAEQAHEARIIPFAATADQPVAPDVHAQPSMAPAAQAAAEPYAPLNAERRTRLTAGRRPAVDTDDTMDLSAVIAASIAGGSSASGGRQAARGAAPTTDHGRPTEAPQASVALADRTTGSLDLGPYDDVPDEVPDWLVGARDGGGNVTRRRVMIGLMAFVALSVLAVGAGAFMRTDPTREVFDGTTAVPAPESDLDAAEDRDAAGGDGPATSVDRGRDVGDAEAAGRSSDADGDGGRADASAEDTATGGGDGGSGSKDPSSGGGGKTSDEPTKQPVPAGGGDPEPGPPAGGDDDPGTGGGGGTTGDPDPTPSPTPSPTPTPPADGGGGGATDEEPGASEHPAPSTTPAQT